MTMTSVFKSVEGRDTIRAYYNGILGALPLTQRTIETSFGETFVLEAGGTDAPPVILLHGSCSNSAAWLGDLPALASLYHVFAADIPGEPGNSGDHRLDFLSDAYPRWLYETLDALKIPKAAMIGNSLGGWLALQFAVAYPARTSALALIAPSGIAMPRPDFLRSITDVASNRDSAKAANEAMAEGANMPKEALEFMALVMEHFIPFTDALPVLSDTQMRLLTMPVLYIAGEDDITMDVEAVSQRLASLVPKAEIDLREGGHIITSAADRILPFLAGIRGE